MFMANESVNLTDRQKSALIDVYKGGDLGDYTTNTLKKLVDHNLIYRESISKPYIITDKGKQVYQELLSMHPVKKYVRAR